MTRVLMLVAGADQRRGVNGATTPAGYWASEVLDCFEKLRSRNVKVTVATVDGEAPVADSVSLDPRFHYHKTNIAFAKAMARASMRAAEDARVDLASMTEHQAIVARRIGRYLLAANVTPESVQSILEAAVAQVLSHQKRPVDALLEQKEVCGVADRSALERIVQDHAAESRTKAAGAHAALSSLEPLSAETRPAQCRKWRASAGSSRADTSLASAARIEMAIPAGNGTLPVTLQE